MNEDDNVDIGEWLINLEKEEDWYNEVVGSDEEGVVDYE
jgi:hypothetical protein